MHLHFSFFFFFFNDTATTEIYTLSLHDALPIWARCWIAIRKTDRAKLGRRDRHGRVAQKAAAILFGFSRQDRKSTRLNSSHSSISYAVFCLKKKKKTEK